MYHYASQSLSATQNYKLLSGSIIPRPIAWVTTLGPSPENTLNIAPFSFFNTLSGEIPLLSLSVGRKLNHQPKDTATNILETREAVVHLVDASLLDQMNLTASSLPNSTSEATLIDPETTPSRTVAVPALVAAKIRFETTLYQYIPVKNDHGQVMTDLFLLKVTDFYFDESVLNPDTFHIDINRLNPIARLSGPHYGLVGKQMTRQRPK